MSSAHAKIYPSHAEEMRARTKVTVAALYVLLCYPCSTNGGKYTVDILLTRWLISLFCDEGCDDCTRGFMTVDRIHKVLDSNRQVEFNKRNSQAIVPGMTFKCSGSISSWTFGAGWYGSGNTESYTELQIWRSSGDGSYTKVGSTTIMTEENTTQLYEYPLSSPLPFKEGDILGCYLPSESRSQLRLQFGRGYGHRLYFTNDVNSSASHFSMDHLNVRGTLNHFHPLISVETGM